MDFLKILDSFRIFFWNIHSVEKYDDKTFILTKTFIDVLQKHLS